MTSVVSWRLDAAGVEPIAGCAELLDRDLLPVNAAVRAIERRFDVRVESVASLSRSDGHRRYRVRLRAGRKLSRGALLTVERTR